MQQFLKWTLEKIRKEGSLMSWMEEKRFEWVPLGASMIRNLLEGHTFIVITDDERDWFCRYILSDINKTSKNIPLLPFYSLKALFPNLKNIRTKEDMNLLENLLMQSFPNGYIFFYIGRNNDINIELAKRRGNSFIWVMDEHLQNSFHLNSNDEMLDIKLIQLYKLLDKSIDAVLFAEVSLEDE
jgi:hypothetical protein